MTFIDRVRARIRSYFAPGPRNRFDGLGMADRPRFASMDECRAYVRARDARKRSAAARKGWATRRQG